LYDFELLNTDYKIIFVPFGSDTVCSNTVLFSPLSLVNLLHEQNFYAGHKIPKILVTMFCIRLSNPITGLDRP